MRIPVQLSADALAIFEAAGSELANVLLSRHRRILPADEIDHLVLREDFSRAPSATAHLGPTSGGADLRAAANLAPLLHPALTGGVLTAWMGQGGRGRSLTGLWLEVLRQAFAEMARTRKQAPEETPLIAALVLAQGWRRADAAVRAAIPVFPHQAWLRGAAMAGLWLAARTGVLIAFREAGRGGEDPLLARVDATLSPVALLGGRTAAVTSGVTLYGCELAAGIPGAEEVSARLGAGIDAVTAVSEIADLLEADPEAARRAEQAMAVARLRSVLTNALMVVEATGGERPGLTSLLSAPGGLAAALQDDAARKELAEDVAKAGEGPSARGEAAPAFQAAARALRSFKPRDPALAFGLPGGEARREYASAATALLCDVALARLVSAGARVLEPRTGQEAEGGADAEYEAGRLYRVGARGGNILKAASVTAIGHLFVDVKDFTRRTGLLGEAAMADFLRREFYIPILGAAKRYFGGMQHLADKGGVAVNNLLGDALSLSGDIEAMVAVAVEIRRLLNDYADRLARAVSSQVVSKQVAELEAGFAVRLAALDSELAETQAARLALPPGEAGAFDLSLTLEQLQAKRAAVEGERERALARGRGEGLEAGVFISHGAAPLVVTIEDDVFGRNRVAIADRINQSARGTARSPGARARADGLLAAARVAQKNPSLAHAFHVFVGSSFALAPPPETLARALALTRAGDRAGALRAMTGAVADALDETVRLGDDAPGDIYNAGAALSEDALLAWLAAIGEQKPVRRIDLPTDQIDPSVTARWFFPPGTLKLVAVLERDGTVGALFRYAGRAAFKGLGEVKVWELCAETGAAAALWRAHAELFLGMGMGTASGPPR